VNQWLDAAWCLTWWRFVEDELALCAFTAFACVRDECRTA
jgi:hypothetical protein